MCLQRQRVLFIRHFIACKSNTDEGKANTTKWPIYIWTCGYLKPNIASELYQILTFLQWKYVLKSKTKWPILWRYTNPWLIQMVKEDREIDSTQEAMNSTCSHAGIKFHERCKQHQSKRQTGRLTFHLNAHARSSDPRILLL